MEWITTNFRFSSTAAEVIEGVDLSGKPIVTGGASGIGPSRQFEGIGGRYFEDCGEASVVHRRSDNFGSGVAPYALDPENAERLWSLATTLLAP